MPQTNKLGQSRHRFQVGSGLYTTSDTQRGTTPTPSQRARGLSADDPDTRWFALDLATQQSWQDVAPLGMSGRRLYSILNRLRLDAQFGTVDTPPAGPLQPAGVTISNVSATTDGILPGFPCYVFDSGAGADSQWVECSIYKAAVGIPGAGGIGARWLIAGMFPLAAAPDTGNLIPMGGFNRGTSGAFHPAPTPSTGTAIRLRFIVCSPTFYPGPPQEFSLVVQP